MQNNKQPRPLKNKIYQKFYVLQLKAHTNIYRHTPCVHTVILATPSTAHSFTDIKFMYEKYKIFTLTIHIKIDINCANL